MSDHPSYTNHLRTEYQPWDLRHEREAIDPLQKEIVALLTGSSIDPTHWSPLGMSMLEEQLGQHDRLWRLRLYAKLRPLLRYIEMHHNHYVAAWRDYRENGGTSEEYKRLSLMYPVLDRHHRNVNWRPPADDPHAAEFVLTDEQRAAIGPKPSEVEAECDARILDMQPPLPELLARHATGTSETTRLTARVAAIDRERKRALLIKRLRTIRDDFFEPLIWSKTLGTNIKEYVRRAELLHPDDDDAETLDAWHTAAKTALAAATREEDLIGICRLYAAASKNAETEPIWEEPTTGIPEITVSGRTGGVGFVWTGQFPAGVKMIASAVVVTSALDIGDVVESQPFVASRGLGVPTVENGRCAVLLQPVSESSDAETPTRRGIGTVHLVDIQAGRSFLESREEEPTEDE